MIRGMNDVSGGFYGALSGWFADGVKNGALFAFKSINIPIWYIGIGLYVWGVLG